MATTRKSAGGTVVPKEGQKDPVLRYSVADVESKWQAVWRQTHINTQDMIASAKPFYNLMMFPYPSAEGLHVGNMYAFTGTDIFGRYKRMQGYDVFEPIGLDGFGIHSENYALKVGRHPIEQAKRSQENFYRQLGIIGCMYDWSRTVETYDPGYYRWTQWLFVQMFKHGLAYRSTADVNWCPSCKTVLADEQVIDGTCERCGNTVNKRALKQWFFRITAYAGKLLENISSLNWSEKVLVAQKNWIGKKEGITITYPVVDGAGNPIGDIDCFTTRPDTNFGATFVVLAPEHPFVQKLISSDPVADKVGSKKRGVIQSKQLGAIRRYVERARVISSVDRIAAGRTKTGVFTGLYCVNQLNNYRMPLYISDFVLKEFGTGAVVGVPGHDLRDFEFAEAMKIPVVRVVVGPDGDAGPITRASQVQEDAGTMVNSGFLDGKPITEAIELMKDHLEKHGWGERVTTYHLRDWLISRQRYWGPPIPMIYCELCAREGKSWFTSSEAVMLVDKHFDRSSEVNEGVPVSGLFPGEERQNVVRSPQFPAIGNWNLEIGNSAHGAAGWYPVPEEQLPVELPYIEDYKPGDDGVAPLAKHKDFYEVPCPGCGGKARRETDVSDTFLDSSWYFLRYPSVEKPRVEGRASKVAGEDRGSTMEKHPSTTIHPQPPSTMLHKPSDDLPWDPAITKKWLPVDLYTGGAEHSVLHLMYSRFVTMALHDWGYLDFEEPFPNFYAHGLVIKDGAKMSKSKGNVVNPDEYIKLYGADALRLYLMFMGPFSEGGDFRDAAMEGMGRWVGRVWRMAQTSLKSQNPMTNPVLTRAMHKLIKKVGEDIEKRHYNTAIAAMMEFTNLVSDQGGAPDPGLLNMFLRVLAPFAPHITEELWQMLQRKEQGLHSKGHAHASGGEYVSIHAQQWPAYNPEYLTEETVIVVIQVNGKLRDSIRIDVDNSRNQDIIEAKSRESVKVRKYLEGVSVRTIVFIPGKLINFVTG